MDFLEITHPEDGQKWLSYPRGNTISLICILFPLRAHLLMKTEKNSDSISFWFPSRLLLYPLITFFPN